jgi:hypothetical protein
VNGVAQAIHQQSANQVNGFVLLWTMLNNLYVMWGDTAAAHTFTLFSSVTVIDQQYHFCYAIKDHSLTGLGYLGVDNSPVDSHTDMDVSAFSMGYASPWQTTFRITWPNYVDGVIDELRICKLARTVNWMQTEYANQNAPATFSAPGSEIVI